MNLLNILYVAAVVMLLFGACVFVHEFGHFWVALRRGLKVEAFAIGFGPRILSWRRNNVEYSWRAIPLWGFVRLLWTAARTGCISGG
jgi:regulator of sigma E protease